MKKLNSKVTKRIAAIVIAAAAASTVMGCSVEKTVTTTETHTDADGNTVTTTTTETTDENGTVKNETTEVETAEETSFGLQDFEGFYCRTESEEMEDYEITYTYGYQLNGDGTGVFYGQDVVDFTWNETEIHFADNTEVFTMEPGKLTVGDVEYDKIAGTFIAPDPCYVDTDNIDNGIYPAYIDESGINESDGQVTILTEIYTVDTYDIVDINRMAEGDVIYINRQLLPVQTTEQTASGIIEINGGLENGGSAVVAVDESNCFVFAGMDMERSYTLRGVATLAVSEDVKLIDNYDPSEEKVYAGSEAVSALKEIVSEYPLYCHDCSITVEEGAIVEINRVYRP